MATGELKVSTFDDASLNQPPSHLPLLDISGILRISGIPPSPCAVRPEHVLAILKTARREAKKKKKKKLLYTYITVYISRTTAKKSNWGGYTVAGL